MSTDPIFVSLLVLTLPVMLWALTSVGMLCVDPLHRPVRATDWSLVTFGMLVVLLLLRGLTR